MSYRTPILLSPIFRERIWGRKSLAPFFADASSEDDKRHIGEVWFTFEENLTSAGVSLGQLLSDHPQVLGRANSLLLVKLIFTTERLSVQVHPDDKYAALHHNSLGKTEAWYIVDAEPDAEVAAGFRERLTSERARAAAESGEIEHLLSWHKVKRGDVVFVPAGTVHAIGAGLTICEVQENSDVTYRLYDYGRPRELHLDHGIAVSNLEPYSIQSQIRALSPGRDALTQCEYFRMERLRPERAISFAPGLPSYLILICLHGQGAIAGQTFNPGQGWLVPAGADSFSIEGAGSEWILTYTADEPLQGISASA